MSEWRECKLADIAVGFAMGPFGSNIKAENFVSEGIPVIRGKNLNYSRYVDGEFVFLTEKKANSLLKSNCYPGDLVFTHRGTIGQVGLIPENKYARYVVSQSGMKVTVDGEQLDKNFLFYFFKSDIGQHELLQNESQVGVPAISSPLTSLKAVNLSIPPISEQKAIAEVLSSLDDKIDLLQRQNKTLEQMAETLFRQWFVEEAEEDWEETKIKNFNVIVTDYVANGSFASLSENVTYKSEPNYAVLIRLTDFNKNFNNDFVYVDEHAYKFLKKSKLLGGEIIISNVGAYSGTVFKCPNLNRPMTLGPNSIVLKSDFNNYFYLLFRSVYGKYILDGIISGSAQPKFNKTSFRNIILKYPSIEYMVEFEEMVETYFTSIDFNLLQIRTIENLRNTLLPKLMSGEIRIVING